MVRSSTGDDLRSGVGPRAGRGSRYEVAGNARLLAARRNPAIARFRFPHAGLISALVLSLVLGVIIQVVPVPDVGSSRADAAVSPPVTGTGQAGRVPSPGSNGTFGTNSQGGYEPQITVDGECESWGTNYAGVAYASVTETGTIHHGTWSVNQSGAVYANTVPFHNGLPTAPGGTVCPNQPAIGIAATTNMQGYWIATGGGGVFAFGNAVYTPSNPMAPGHSGTIVAVAAAQHTSEGYWLLSSSGQVYAYGGAGYFGGTPPLFTAVGEKIVAMATTTTGGGYWLVSNYGEVWGYGAAYAHMGGFSNPGPGLGTTPYDWYSAIGAGTPGAGFWMVRTHGTIYSYSQQAFTNPTFNVNNSGLIDSLSDTTNFQGFVMITQGGTKYVKGDAVSSANPPHSTPPPVPGPSPPGSSSEQTLGGGNPSTNHTQACGGDPVNCESGDLWQTDTDITVPGKGPYLDLARTYNSLSGSTLGIFGYGWSSTYSMSVAVNPNISAMVTEANGSTVTFYTNTTNSFVAPKGTLATLSRLASGGYTFRLRNTATYLFNSDGRLVGERDLDGYTTTLSYVQTGSGNHRRGQLTSVTDPSGRTITFTYNTAGLVSSVTNPAGGVTSYSYTKKNLVSVTDPAGRVTHYGYDTKHRMVSETSPTGGVTTTTYGSGGGSNQYGHTQGKVIRQQDPKGLVITWSYSGTNSTSGTTTITGPHGSVTKETFTGGQMMTKTTGSGTPSLATWHYTYTATTFGQATEKNPAGKTKYTTYNATGDVTSTKDFTGETTTTTYDSFNEPLVVTDPMGIKTTYTYDTRGNIEKKFVTGSGGSPTQTTTYTYPSAPPGELPQDAGEPTKVTDPSGHVTSYTYDQYGDVTGTTTTTGTTQDVFNILGQQVCQAAPAAFHQGYTCPAGTTRVPHTTSWTYDPDGEVVAETDPTTKTATTAYDVLAGTSPCTSAITGAAYCTAATDASGNVTVTYDDQDARKVGTVDGYGTSAQTTSTTGYDIEPGSTPCATLATAVVCTVTTNGKGQATTNYYNVDTEAIKTVSPGGMVTTATYNGTGKQVTSTTAAGTTTDGYDPDGSLASVRYSGTAGGYIAPAGVTYIYNPDGQRKQMIDGTGTTTYTYDTLGRLTKTTDGAGQSVSYAYDPDNEVTSVTYPDGKSETHTYNTAGQLTSTTDFQGRTTKFSYTLSAPGLAGGSQMTTRFPNGQSTITDDNADGQEVSTALTPSNPWSGTPVILPNRANVQIACTPAGHCVAVGSTSAISSSTNPQGGVWRTADQAYFEKMTAASCPSTTLCVATDSNGGIQIGHGPTTWTETDGRYASIDPTKGLVAITCPSASFCAAVDATGNVVTSTDPAGGVSAWHLTSRPGGHAVTAISCVSSTLCLALDATGQLLTSTNPTGGATKWSTTSIASFSRATALSCNSAALCIVLGTGGQMATSTNPAGGASSWTVTTVGTTTLAKVSCPTATFCVSVNVAGNTFATTNPTGGAGTWKSFTTKSQVSTLACPSSALCVAGEANSVWAGSGFTTWTTTTTIASSYRPNQLMTTQTMKTAGTTTSTASYGYNAAGQLTSSSVSTTPGASGSYAYDAAGDPTSLVNSSNGMTVGQTFNATGQLTKSTPNGGTATTFGYDSIGARVSATTGGSSTSYHYGQAAELSKVTSTAVTQSYAYNGDGLRMSEKNGPNGLSSWSWNGTLATVGGSAATVRGVSCPTATVCVAANSKDGVFAKDPTATSGWEYQAFPTVPGAVPWNDLTEISCSPTVVCVASGGSGYVAAGSPSGLTGTWHAYHVDGVRQLTAVSCPSASLCVATDATGYVVTTTKPKSTTWSSQKADTSGRLDGISCTRSSHCVAIDTSGNVVTSSNPSQNQSWRVKKVDASGRPLAISCPSTTLCVMIDQTGNVFTSTNPMGGSTTWHSIKIGNASGLTALSCPNSRFCAVTTSTHSTYSTANPTGTGSTWHPIDQSTSVASLSCVSATLCVGGSKKSTYNSRSSASSQFTWDTQTTTPQLLATSTENFLYGPNGQVVEQEGMTSTGHPLYLVHDALGSTRIVTNPTRVESTYSYGAYGAVTKHTGPNTTPIGYAGAFTDLGTGLLYLVERYYTPFTGQFLSVDPKVATTHEPYQYAGDDPENSSDPSGESWSRTWWGFTPPIPGCDAACGRNQRFWFDNLGGSKETVTEFHVTTSGPLSVFVLDALPGPTTTFWVCAEPMGDCQMATLVYGKGIRATFGTHDRVATSGTGRGGPYIEQGFTIKIEAEVDPLFGLWIGETVDPLYAMAIGSWNGLSHFALTSTLTGGCGGVTLD
jgi:RHS repeat-associated protein